MKFVWENKYFSFKTYGLILCIIPFKIHASCADNPPQNDIVKLIGTELDYLEHTSQEVKKRLNEILFNAITNGYVEIVRKACKSGANPHIKTTLGLSTMHLATIFNTGRSLFDMLYLFNNYKVDTCHTDVFGNTALHYAVKHNTPSIAKFFMKSINKPNKVKATPLDFACMSKKSFEIVLFLLKNNATLTTEGATTLHCAALGNDERTIKRIIAANSMLINKTTDDETPLMWACNTHSAGSKNIVKTLWECGSDLLHSTKSGFNCMHKAALSGHIDIMNFFLTLKKFDINAATYNTLTTPILCACNHTNHARAFEMVQLLHSHGANLSIKNKQGAHAIHLAAYHGHTDIVQWLIEKQQVNAYEKDNNNNTPFMYACKNDQETMINLLYQYIDTRDIVWKFTICKS